MDDAVMKVIIREVLDRPGQHKIPPETLDELLRRLLGLLERETAKRPAHRPRDDIGRHIATMIESGAPPAKAKRLAAKMYYSKTLQDPLKAAAEAYRRYRKRVPQK
jgi:hypothetical protein